MQRLPLLTFLLHIHCYGKKKNAFLFILTALASSFGRFWHSINHTLVRLITCSMADDVFYVLVLMPSNDLSVFHGARVQRDHRPSPGVAWKEAQRGPDTRAEATRVRSNGRHHEAVLGPGRLKEASVLRYRENTSHSHSRRVAPILLEVSGNV